MQAQTTADRVFEDKGYLRLWPAFCFRCRSCPRQRLGYSALLWLYSYCFWRSLKLLFKIHLQGCLLACLWRWRWCRGNCCSCHRSCCLCCWQSCRCLLSLQALQRIISMTILLVQKSSRGTLTCAQAPSRLPSRHFYSQVPLPSSRICLWRKEDVKAFTRLGKFSQ